MYDKYKNHEKDASSMQVNIHKNLLLKLLKYVVKNENHYEVSLFKTMS